jgi:cytochrome c oxidase cbb3-type subunit 2
MNIRTFLFGMILTFGSAWLLALVVPYYKTREIKPVPYDEVEDEKTGFYFPKRAGTIAQGAKVYAQNGCYVCHTQLVRPTYAGNDMHRDGVAGFKGDPDRGDTRRETIALDYTGETFAQIGVMRIGPDLANVGTRFRKVAADLTSAKKESAGDSFDNRMIVTAESLLFAHLHNPRATVAKRWSTCPSSAYLFEENGMPKGQAIALVSYLMSMKKDDAVPASISYGQRQVAK